MKSFLLSFVVASGLFVGIAYAANGGKECPAEKSNKVCCQKTKTSCCQKGLKK